MTEPAVIEIHPKHPVVIAGKPIASFTVKPQMFVAYLAAVEAARRVDGDLATSIWREWLIRNVVPLDSSGSPVAFTITDAMQLPAFYASRFRALHDQDGSAKGKIIRDGDGIDTPCTYALGTPLAMGTNAASGDDAGSIIELEFLVRTLADIEPVLLADGTFEQADALIRKCGKPLSAGDVTLMRLPEAAMAALTMADGLSIATQVLPRFLG